MVKSVIAFCPLGLFGGDFFFFFNIQGLTRNDKTDSNKKCIKLENIGNLSCKIVETRSSGIYEIILLKYPLARK